MTFFSVFTTSLGAPSTLADFRFAESKDEHEGNNQPGDGYDHGFYNPN